MSAKVAASVYCNGELTLAGGARVRADDDGLLFGLGFFETFRTAAGKPHLWALHVARLDAACRVAGIELPAHFLARDEARLRRVAAEMLEAERLSDGVFRYTVTAGAASTSGGYTAPGELLAIRALPAEAPADGVALRVLKLRRDNGEWLPRPKSLSFSNALLGARELERRAQAPADNGLFLARDSGCAVEAVWQNLLWIEGGRLCFPDPALGAVAGTGLAWVRSIRPEAQPRRVALAELLRAEAVMIVNSVRGVTPVAEIWDEDDRARLGRFRSHEHPIAAELRSRWREALRETAEG